MTIPLERMHSYPQAAPPAGQLSIVVARHQATSWPGPMVTAYAQQRAQLIHQLVDDTDATVVSWGDTDGAYPREVVEIILALGPTLVASLGSVLSTWIVHKRTSKKDRPPAEPVPPPPDTKAALPGVSLVRSDGARLELTYRDGLTATQARELVDDFMAGAAGPAADKTADETAGRTVGKTAEKT